MPNKAVLYADAHEPDKAADLVECPSCRAWRDKCRLCSGTGQVTEQQAKDFGAEP